MFRGLKKEGFAVKLVSILAVLIFSLSDLPAAGAQALKEIRIGTSDVTSTNFSIYYAKDRRFFEREGLDPKMIIVKAEAILAALSAGELGYTTFSTSAVEATLVGMPFRLVAVANEQPVWGLVVPKSVNQVSELKRQENRCEFFRGHDLQRRRLCPQAFRGQSERRYVPGHRQHSDARCRAEKGRNRCGGYCRAGRHPGRKRGIQNPPGRRVDLPSAHGRGQHHRKQNP